MKLTVGKKLFAAFGFLLFMLVLVGGNGVYGLKNMNVQTTEITTSWMPGVESINNINYLTERALSLELKMILETDKAALQTLDQQAQATLEQIDKEFQTYDKTIILDEDRQNFTQLQAKWNTYKSLHIEIVKTANQVSLVKGVTSAQAAQITELLKKSQATFNDMQINLDFLVKLNHDGAAQAAQISEEIYSKGTLTTLLAAGVAVVLGLLFSGYLIRSISVPVRVVSQALQRVSAGDLTLDEVQVKNKDEIGDLVASLNYMTRDLRRTLRQVNDASINVSASSEELTASADHTTHAAEQIARSIQQVAIGAEQQMHGVEESSQLILDMSSAVQQIADHAKSVSENAEQSSNMAAEGADHIGTVIEQMTSINEMLQHFGEAIRELGEGSGRIGQIVDTMTAIAKQTNLLALNAAIEASRAGEHGRGFAVVSDEVRKLAEQSTQSAQQIAGLVGTIQAQTNTVVHTMATVTQEVATGINGVRVAGSTFEQIREAVESVTRQIQEVSHSSQQLSAGTEQVISSIRNIAAVAESSAVGTQEVSAATQEQLATMEEVSTSAKELSQSAEVLQELILKFRV